MYNILIIGDSFAADWTVKYPNQKGWPNLLAERFSVKNLAQAGISEYKIYQQIMSVDNINDYNLCIVSHTSPYRIVTRKHPVHSNDKLHHNADLILSDIDYHCQGLGSLCNPSLRSAQAYINHHFDIEYHETTYNLYKNEINNKLANKKTIILNNFLDQLTIESNQFIVDTRDIQKTHAGLINHFSLQGNQIIFEKIINYIQS